MTFIKKDFFYSIEVCYTINYNTIFSKKYFNRLKNRNRKKTNQKASTILVVVNRISSRNHKDMYGFGYFDLNILYSDTECLSFLRKKQKWMLKQLILLNCFNSFKKNFKYLIINVAYSVPNWICKYCKKNSSILTILYNKSLALGRYQTGLKIVRVILFPKLLTLPSRKILVLSQSCIKRVKLVHDQL